MKVCIVCKKEFVSNYNNQKTCSIECRKKKWKFYKDLYNKKYNCSFYNKRKLKALNIVGKGNLICSNCGCKDVRILEINHINGGGYKEYKNIRNKSSRTAILTNEIVMGRRTIDDLNILCHVCNHAYFVKLKYGIEYNIKLK